MNRHVITVTFHMISWNFHLDKYSLDSFRIYHTIFIYYSIGFPIFGQARHPSSIRIEWCVH
uniref:Uncharacterized protein n=1 Tax=Podoviridae sp. ctIi96 TaxID=2826550 RepID=A0A8S5M1T4_9CAUD|nr:MAG TPA: hypothetical protein [Podoviridae sp. ctIi96]